MVQLVDQCRVEDGQLQKVFATRHRDALLPAGDGTGAFQPEVLADVFLRKSRKPAVQPQTIWDRSFTCRHDMFSIAIGLLQNRGQNMLYHAIFVENRALVP